MSKQKTQSPGRGSDAKATEALKLQAQIIIRVCKMRGYKHVITEVKKRYENFGRANGKGYEHNSEGAKMALDLLAKYNPGLANQVRLVLGIKAVSIVPDRMSIEDARKRIVAAGIGSPLIHETGTNQFRVTIKPAFRGLVSLVEDSHWYLSRQHNGDDVYMVTFMHLGDVMPENPPAHEAGENTADAIPDPESPEQPAVVAEKTRPMRVVKKLRRHTAKAIRKDDKVNWQDTGIKEFAVTKHGAWYSGKAADGTPITFHEGHAAFIGAWIEAVPS